MVVYGTAPALASHARLPALGEHRRYVEYGFPVALDRRSDGHRGGDREVDPAFRT